MLRYHIFFIPPYRYKMKHQIEIQPISMGIGKLGEPDNIFVRKFRYTVKGQHLDDFSIKSFSFDLKKKHLELKAYELLTTGGSGDIPVDVWAQGMSEDRWPNETLTLRTFDGCGKPIYEYTFHGLQILERCIRFDYGDSEASIQEILLSFDSFRRELLFPINTDRWTVLLDGTDREVPLDLEGRPKIDVEPTSVNHLNARFFLPGKASWQKLRAWVKNEDAPILSPLINSAVNEDYQKATLKLYDGNNVHKESWVLDNLWVSGFNKLQDKSAIDLVFDNVSYQPTSA